MAAKRPHRRTSSRPSLPSRSNRTTGSETPRTSFVNYYALAIAGGIVARLIVFAFVGYFNNDNHLAVIDYVARHWSLPRADALEQAYHPPLYYLLAAPLLRAAGLVGVQALSLVFSIASLVLIGSLLRQLPWIREATRLWCLALAAFHPQLILFSLFISNDTLAIFLGALILHQAWQVQLSPSLGRVLLLGTFLGLGLLTKAVFVVFVFPLGLFLWLVGRRYGWPCSQTMSRLALFLGIAGVLGCYRYVENLVLFGNPAISNLDFGDWTEEQRPTWLGLYSLLDFNLFKLIRDPLISPATVHSYPLMIYGSFWYALIPESTFQGNLIPPFNRIGSMIYVAALVPTLLMVLGAGRMAMAPCAPDHRAGQDASLRQRHEYEGILVLILFLNLALIVSVGWKYDVWSVFQGRLLFPSYGALLLAFASGMEWAVSSRAKIMIARTSVASLIALFWLYLTVEVWLSMIYPANPLRMNHVPFKVDMTAR